MKRILLTASLMALLPLSAYATGIESNTITLVNHFNSAIEFTVRKSDIQTVPDFKPNFVLNQQGSITSRVIPGAAAYIASKDTKQSSVFFAVENVNDEVVINGYISKGIAYSWDHSVITFCTPDDYKTNGHC